MGRFRESGADDSGDMVAALEDTYSSFIGFEFMHIHNTEVRNWIRERIEARVKNQAMDLLLEANQIELPTVLITQEIKALKAQPAKRGPGRPRKEDAA